MHNLWCNDTNKLKEVLLNYLLVIQLLMLQNVDQYNHTES